jgi:hypothetical protein
VKSSVTLEEAISITNWVLDQQLGRKMSDLETLIFQGAWAGHTYPQIAEVGGYSVNYLTTDIGPKFWRMLSQALGEPVTKKNFKAAITRHQVPIDAMESRRTATMDWGEAPDVRCFYGREEELAILTRWLLVDQCRLIGILGMGGIGKTTLAVQLGHTLEQEFETLIWRSLRHAPSLNQLLKDLLTTLSHPPISGSEISALLEYLRHHRCLIILDNVESLLQARTRAGRLRPDYQDYSELFRRLGESAHRSCILLTSREKPAELGMLEGLTSTTRTLQLSGSQPTALALIAAAGLQGSIADQKILTERYSHNPLALKIVATTIQDLFSGNIQAFLKEDIVVFSNIRHLLEQQFLRLSELEKSMMISLAINRDWTDLDTLTTALSSDFPKTKALEALESLRWRGLLETRAGTYSQQPVIMDFVTSYLCEHMAAEILNRNLNLIHQYPLIKTTEKDYITQSQIQLILSSITEQLMATVSSSEELQALMAELLQSLRCSFRQDSYAPGNLFNLCISLNLDLKLLDFSCLTLSHVDLRRGQLQHSTFSNVTFQNALFLQTFGIVFSGCFSRNGQVLITGDSAGELQIWRGSDLELLARISVHSSYVWDMAISPDQSTVATCSEDGTVKLCNLVTYDCLQTLSVSPTAVQSLAWISMSLMVTGSDNGDLKIWDLADASCTQTLTSHQSLINRLVYHPENGILASSSNDGTVKLWDPQTGQCL